MVALPYYFNAIESSRLTEAVVLWGRQKDIANGAFFTPAQAGNLSSRINNQNPLKYFTVQIICQQKQSSDEPCWEAEFTQRNLNARVRYKLTTTHNFKHLACVGLNSAGENFCLSQSQQDDPENIENEQVYEIR